MLSFMLILLVSMNGESFHDAGPPGTGKWKMIIMIIDTSVADKQGPVTLFIVTLFKSHWSRHLQLRLSFQHKPTQHLLLHCVSY